MKYYVKWEVHHTLGEAEVSHLKKEVIDRLEYIEKSGKMKDGGPLLGIRGGYFIFDIKEPSELMHLLGTAIWDNCHVESYPVMSYKDLRDFLKEDLKKAA
jgi:hypothetical protein